MLNCIIATMGAKSGDEGGKHAKFVHPAQRAFRIVVIEKEREEQSVGRRIVPHPLVDQMQICSDKAHRLRVDERARAHPLLEHPQQVERVCQELLFARDL